MYRPNASSCEDCRRHHEAKYNTGAPCEEDGSCKFGRPDLYTSNHMAWELYQKCCSQVIVAGMGQPLGIKFEAIAFIFDIYQVDGAEERRNLFEKIQAVDMVRLKKSQQETTIGNGQLNDKGKSHRSAVRSRR